MDAGRRHGFTLLEIVVVVALLGLVGTAVAVALGYGARAYVFAGEQSALAQKARLALTRMRVELMELEAVGAASTGDSLTFTDRNKAAATLVHSGNLVRLNGHTLVNGLGAYGVDTLFTFTNDAAGTWNPATDDINDLSAINITLLMTSETGQQTLTFTTTVNPRNTDAPDAPELLIAE